MKTRKQRINALQNANTPQQKLEVMKALVEWAKERYGTHLQCAEYNDCVNYATTGEVRYCVAGGCSNFEMSKRYRVESYDFIIRQTGNEHMLNVPSTFWAALQSGHDNVGDDRWRHVRNFIILYEAKINQQ